MKRMATLAAGAALLSMAAIAAVEAAPAGPQSMAPAVAAQPDPLLQQVHYPACRAWAHECAVRWGWRTWRWGRCMRLHAC